MVSATHLFYAIVPASAGSRDKGNVAESTFQVPFQTMNPLQVMKDAYKVIYGATDLRSSLVKVFYDADEDVADIQPELKGLAKEFADKWLSVFGMASSTTGIISEFMANGASYGEKVQSKLGSLMSDLKDFDFQLVNVKKNNGKPIRMRRVKELKKWLKTLQFIFQKGQPLHTAVSELHHILAHGELGDLLIEHLQKSEVLKRLYEMFAPTEYKATQMAKNEEL